MQVEGELSLSNHVTDGGSALGVGLDEGSQEPQMGAQQLLFAARQDLGTGLHEGTRLLIRQLPGDTQKRFLGQGHTRRGLDREQGDQIHHGLKCFLARGFERLPGQRKSAGVVRGEVAPLGGQALGEDAGPQIREVRRHVADEVLAVQALEVATWRGGVLAVHPHEEG